MIESVNRDTHRNFARVKNRKSGCEQDRGDWFVSSDRSSGIVYDGVFVFNVYEKNPEIRRSADLGKNYNSP